MADREDVRELLAALYLDGLTTSELYNLVDEAIKQAQQVPATKHDFLRLVASDESRRPF